MLIIAALLIFLTGCLHSYLGERYLLIRLFKRGNLPQLFGGTASTQGTLRFAWHLTTLAWWAMAAIVLLADQGGLSRTTGLQVIGCTALVSAALPIYFTRGKHLSWIVFLAVAALVFWAAQQA